MTNSFVHYGVVQYSNNCFDFYFNCGLVNSIYQNYEHKIDENPEQYIKFTDVIHGKKKIYLIAGENGTH